MAALIAVLYSAVLVIRTLLYGNQVPGYASLISIMLFLGGRAQAMGRRERPL